MILLFYFKYIILYFIFYILYYVLCHTNTKLEASYQAVTKQTRQEMFASLFCTFILLQPTYSKAPWYDIKAHMKHLYYLPDKRAQVDIFRLIQEPALMEYINYINNHIHNNYAGYYTL